MVKTNQSLRFYDFISLPLRFYSAAGIKMFQWDSEDIMTKLDKFLLVFLTINLFLNFIAKCCFFIFGKFDSPLHLTEWFLYLLFATNGLCKCLSVVMGRKDLFKVLKDLEKISPSTPQERRKFEMLKYYKHVMRHSIFMGIQHFAIATFFVIFPMVKSIVAYMSLEEENRVFVGYTPYILIYPFESKRGIGYVLVYLTQFIGGFTISCYTVGSDMLLMCCTYLVLMHFDDLRKRIDEFKTQGYAKDMKELGWIFERHDLLNHLATTVNDVFSISNLFNYMVSISILCMVCLLISLGSEFGFHVIKFVGFFLSALVHVYYICMFGNLLMEHSASIGEALMGQEWYTANVHYQKMIVVGIARSQRLCYLTAYKFFPISMESFSNLMTTVYQLFTLLKAQMEES
ncbi:odorant receptor 85c-like [Haematobia irritans]|uniref:odorant receptor 85c-like n=1 Tax=Haematobia irritans TaxID=7368 RepID=UPI003F4F4770